MPEPTELPADRLAALVHAGGDAAEIARLARALPATASLRELLGAAAHDDPLPAARVLWRRDACFTNVTWLPRVGRLVAEELATWSLELCDAERGATVGALPRGQRHASVQGVLLDATTQQPRWIGPLEQTGSGHGLRAAPTGPALCWVSVQRDRLRVDARLPIADGLRRVLPHGRDGAVVIASWDGEVMRAREAVAQWSFRAPGDDATLCRALGDGADHVFVFSRDGLCCLDGRTGVARWTNPTVGPPRGAVPITLHPDGDVYYLDHARAYRLAARDGATRATLELPDGSARRFASAPGGVSAALAEVGAYIADGHTVLGELSASGTLWGGDDRVERHAVSSLTQRVVRLVGEHTVEVGPNSLHLPAPAGELRRRMHSRWLRLAHIEHVGPATDHALVLRRTSPIAAATGGEWMAVSVF